MRIVKNIALALLLIILGAWCAIHFRAEWQQVSFPPLAQSVRFFALAMALSLLNYVLRALRWSRYLARLGHSHPYGFSVLAYFAGFAFALSPAKLGELARVRYYAAHGTPLSELAAVSVVERLMDVAAMLTLAVLALAAFPGYTRSVLLMAAIAALAGAALMWLPWERLAARARPPGSIPAFVSTVTRALEKTLHAARSLLLPRYLLTGWLIGIVAWGAEGVGLYLLTSMSSPTSITVMSAVGVYAIATLAGAATLLPGGLLGTEAAMAALLTASGFPVGDALLITVACRLVTLWFAIALGWLAVFLLEARVVASHETL